MAVGTGVLLAATGVGGSDDGEAAGAVVPPFAVAEGASP